MLNALNVQNPSIDEDNSPDEDALQFLPVDLRHTAMAPASENGGSCPCVHKTLSETLTATSSTLWLPHV